MSSASDTFEIGRKLVELCSQGRNLEAIEQLYAPTIVSIETHGSPEMPARMQGIDAIRQKNQWWFQNHTIHSGQVQGPWPHGERFIVTMKYEITPKAGPMAGQRMTVEEAGLYTVRDGKIVQEEFFYHM